MQSDCKQIYKLTAKKYGESEQLYKDIGNFIFAKLYSMMRRPESLILKLRGVGQWHLRRRRMQLLLNKLMPVLEIETPLQIFRYESEAELRALFTDRLKDYEDYVELRDQIRRKRHETQKLLEPNIGKDEGAETS